MKDFFRFAVVFLLLSSLAFAADTPAPVEQSAPDSVFYNLQSQQTQQLAAIDGKVSSISADMGNFSSDMRSLKKDVSTVKNLQVSVSSELLLLIFAGVFASAIVNFIVCRQVCKHYAKQTYEKLAGKD